MAKRTRIQVVKYFKTGDDDAAAAAALEKSLAAAAIKLVSLKQEHCYYAQLAEDAPLGTEGEERLRWLIAETFEPEKTATASFFPAGAAGNILEVGPRLSFATAFSSNAVSICASCGLSQVVRLECSKRYLIETSPPLSQAQLVAAHATAVHDRMTECVYETPLTSFDPPGGAPVAAPVTTIKVLSEGRAALEAASSEMGLGFDAADLDLYTALFKEHLGRDPTDVECFDMGQSNSEHSRHWFFSGVIEIDGVAMPTSLFKLVKKTLEAPYAKQNSIIAFHDNSSAIVGSEVTALAASAPAAPAAYTTTTEVRHPILTAETHNFPCGIAPFPGAETGTGGRIRDVHATGRGALVVAGVSAYCMGNLNIPGYSESKMPWEDATAALAGNLASPLAIQISASNGASDYGNKFGEPVIVGFNRSFGMRLPSGERREWLKPIMFSAGLGQMPACLAKKGAPEVGMWVVKIGGPAYRIGLGGGAASSKAGGETAGPTASDFNAVQRGDAEMENKMNRVIRACVERGVANPIVSIHDQGAGGNGNVLKEIAEPLGAKLNVRNICSGDPTLSVLELWGAEYQENCALLLRDEDQPAFREICERENCPASFVGRVSGDGRVVLEDSDDGSTPVDLPLALVLADMPKKTFKSQRLAPTLTPLSIPADATLASALDRVLRLPAVGSKRFLTNKVDRSVTGLIAQQQCVGPYHTPLADVGVIAHSHHDLAGAATAVGEQPIKGLLSPAAMARLTVAESVTNLVWASVGGDLGLVKCSANWMWAAKLEGEAAAMYDCCSAMCDCMGELGISVDGGKDSLSMAAKAGGETVKAPGSLVVTAYGACDDVTKTVTPDLKGASAAGGKATLLYLIDCSGGRKRLGGSALAQCYAQLGDCPADLDDASVLRRAFGAVQGLVASRTLLAGHDVSDGGLIVTLLEMAIAGDVGIDVTLPAATHAADVGGVGGGGGLAALAAAFAEEVGMVVEVADGAGSAALLAAMDAAKVPCIKLGSTTTTTGGAAAPRVAVAVPGASSGVDMLLGDVRMLWEATSFELEKLQCNPQCVAQEEAAMRTRTPPQWQLSYKPAATVPALLKAPTDARPQVCVLRQEGSNGDREMAAALYAAGLAPWDVAMTDLVSGKLTLDRFRGVVFVGGFSYADVLGSAKGWAAVLKFNAPLWEQLQAFRARSDTFSLGVCNGCQLMALLGWVPAGATDKASPSKRATRGGNGAAAAGAAELMPPGEQPRFVHNTSGRFESRFSSVRIEESPAVLLDGMAGSTLGVWVAHGEGRAHFPESKVLDACLAKKLAPIRYVDDAGAPTESYPFNPNGAVHGIAALCSADGRHLAMMPHPERCFLTWQWPWAPAGWDQQPAGAWLKLFQNARAFCDASAK